MSSLISKYTKEELEKIVSQSFSYAEVIRKAGYSTKSGDNLKTVKKIISYYNISVDHFTHKENKKYLKDEIFCENSKVSQAKLRRVVFEEKIFEYKCDICGQDEIWNGKQLVLTLDHKNGINNDNRIENLRWVCPNCDRQLDTYGMKNKKNLSKKKVCFDSENIINKNVIKDKKRSFSNTHIEPPQRDELKDILYKLKNFTDIANRYNVSTTTIRRWCRYYNLPAQINIIKYTSVVGWKNETWCDIKKQKHKIKQNKKCAMLDENGNTVLEFDSLSHAAEYVLREKKCGGSLKSISVNISRVCNGKRNTCYGFHWTFI